MSKSWTELKAEFKQERTCPCRAHRVVRVLLINRTSSWNSWVRKIGRRFHQGTAFSDFIEVERPER